MRAIYHLRTKYSLKALIHTVWVACNHYKVFNTHSVNSVQSLQGVKYTLWIPCSRYKVLNTHSVNSLSHYNVLNTHSVNSMQSLKVVKCRQGEFHATLTGVKLTGKLCVSLYLKKHQITQINELEVTFNWKWNSKQKNHITWKSQCKIYTTFQNFLHPQKS